jgi:uncharacterized damage-inducible protein DinB
VDRGSLEELFAYTGWTWETHAVVLRPLSDERLREPVSGSGWPSLIAPLLHIVLAYDGWLHGGWALELGPRLRPYEFQPANWAELQAYRDEARVAFRKALEVPDAELDRDVVLDFGDGAVSRMNRRQMLTNLLIHERGHHGDINTLLYQSGLRIPIVDYGRYIRFPNEVAFEDEE